MKSNKNNSLWWFISLVSLVLIVNTSRSIYELWQKRGIVNERQRQLEKIQSENNRLKIKLKEVQGDDFVEQEARDKLGMTKEGETLILIPNDQSVNLQRTDENNPSANLSNWQKWWRLFF